MRRLRVLAIMASVLALWVMYGFTPRAQADISMCLYPGVGVGVNVAGINGASCDYPTEINGSHWHCQGGGVGLGLGGALVGLGSNATIGGVFTGQGTGGISCNWRCPDGVDAPAPNPPGAWVHYLVPMTTTNYCKDHMDPNGFWSAPVLPTEGIPPAGEQQPDLIPQPVPPPQTWAITPPPAPPLAPAMAPGFAPTDQSEASEDQDAPPVPALHFVGP